MNDLATQLPAATRHAIRESVIDPVRFAKTWLNTKLWKVQQDILRAVATSPRTAVKACHSSGKSFVAAAAVHWWVTRYPDGIVITTAPTFVQVEKVLWGEIHRAARRARYTMPALLKTELKNNQGNYALGLSTNEGVRFQGFHGRILIVIDEAPGVTSDIWEAIEGIRAGGDVRILALGNPTIASGPFYDAFTTNREGWSTFTISAFDTPNLDGLDLGQLLQLPNEELDRNGIWYLTTRRWVAEKYREWGPGHPLWESRVLGQFPTQAEDALISLAWLEAAKDRAPLPATGRLRAGLDVAGPGEDETVLAISDGGNLLSLQAWASADARGDVVAALEPYRAQLETVNVDAIGIGYNFGLHLRDLDFPVRLVNVGQAARDADNYKNRKAEHYWGLREHFRGGAIAGLRDERAIGQLAGIRYRHTAAGKVEIEPKDEAAKRGVKSPDRAEALMLCFADSRTVEVLPTLEGVEPMRRNGNGNGTGELHPFDQQIHAAMPAMFDSDERLTCGSCINRATKKDGTLYCQLRRFSIRDADLQCDFFDLRPS